MRSLSRLQVSSARHRIVTHDSIRLSENLLAAGRDQLTAALHSFYDFEAKVVLCVGAGRGQLLDQRIITTKTMLIDTFHKSSPEASHAVLPRASEGRPRIIQADFNDVNITGDVAYFEFCPMR